MVTFNSMGRFSKDVYAQYKYLFSNIPAQEQEAQAIVDVPLKLGYDTAVITYANNAYAQLLAKFVKAYWEAKGHKTLAFESHELDQKDFRTSLLKYKAANPDVFFNLVYTWQQGSAILTQAAEMGWKPKFVMNTDMVVAPELLQQAAQVAEGIVAISAAWDPFDMNNRKAQDFKTKYMQKYGRDPTGFGAGPYDATYMFADAIKRGGYTGEGIRAALLSMKDFYGVGGLSMSMSTDVNVVQKSISYVTVKNGQYTTYTPPK